MWVRVLVFWSEPQKSYQLHLRKFNLFWNLFCWANYIPVYEPYISFLSLLGNWKRVHLRWLGGEITVIYSYVGGVLEWDALILIAAV